jgi:hypothetical protein
VHLETDTLMKRLVLVYCAGSNQELIVPLTINGYAAALQVLHHRIYCIRLSCEIENYKSTIWPQN